MALTSAGQTLEIKNMWLVLILSAIAVLCSPALEAAQQKSTPVIAIIDSGVDRNHGDLASTTITGHDFTGRKDPFLDNVGHGTAMASIIAGNGRAPGLCTDCRLMSLKVMMLWTYQ